MLEEEKKQKKQNVGGKGGINRCEVGLLLMLCDLLMGSCAWSKSREAKGSYIRPATGRLVTARH